MSSCTYLTRSRWFVRIHIPGRRTTRQMLPFWPEKRCRISRPLSTSTSSTDLFLISISTSCMNKVVNLMSQSTPCYNTHYRQITFELTVESPSCAFFILCEISMRLGTGASSGTSATSDATCLITLEGKTVLEQEAIVETMDNSLSF